MAQLDLKAIKKLRDETSASIADCRRALEEAKGDEKKALEWLKKRAGEIVATKSVSQRSSTSTPTLPPP